MGFGRDSNYLIVNPGDGDDYFEVNGTATTATTQPKVLGGAARGLGANRELLDSVAHGLLPHATGGGDYVIFTSADNGPADGAGTHFGSMTAGKYVMRRVTTELAGGVSKTLLQGGHSHHAGRSGLHPMTHMRSVLVATAIRENSWVAFSGAFTNPNTTPTAQDDIGTWGTDHAATPTDALPGELVYKEPKPLPELDDYKARTLG
jgi:hypothetical protein